MSGIKTNISGTNLEELLEAAAKLILNKELSTIRHSVSLLEDSFNLSIDKLKKDLQTRIDKSIADTTRQTGSMKNDLTATNKRIENSKNTLELQLTGLKKDVTTALAEAGKKMEERTNSVSTNRTKAEKVLGDKLDSEINNLQRQITQNTNNINASKNENNQTFSLLRGFAASIAGGQDTPATQPPPTPQLSSKVAEVAKPAPQTQQTKSTSSTTKNGEDTKDVILSNSKLMPKSNNDNIPNSNDIENNIDKLFNL